MSDKISALPPATVCNLADLITAVQAGVNVSMVREIFLQANTGEAVYMNNLQGVFFSCEDAAGIQADIVGQEFLLNDSVNNDSFSMTGGIWGLTCGISLTLAVAGGSSNVTVDSSGVTIGGPTVSISFNAGSPTDWAGSAPIDIRDAIDRLATAVAGLLGHAIP